jgi:serine/threonine protein phosphatase PrpC
MSTTPKIPAVEIAVRTDPGRDPDKQVNEDASFQKETALGLLAVVCDGMGGHAGGKEASELAIKTIAEIVEAAPAATGAAVALKRAVEEANARIWSMPTAEAGYRPGSTVVAMLIHDGGAEVAHVGDSRLYLAHAGVISQVTRDHSMVQEMVDRNLIRAEDAAKHPDANKILRALGIAKDVEVDVRPEPVVFVTGDVFVLCSDGLSDLVEPAEILQIAGSHPPAQAAGQLVDLANARGGHDNITAMVIRMKASATVADTGDRTRRGVAKTIPLTAAPSGAPEPLPGPTGTYIAGPAAHPSGVPAHPAPPGAPVAPVAPVVSPSAASIPNAPPPSRPSLDNARSRTPWIVVGIVLAVIAVGIIGVLVFVANRKPTHRSVPVVDDRRDIHADAGPDDDDAGADPVVEPAPPLNPEPSGKPLHHHHHHDGGAHHGSSGAPAPQGTPVPPPPNPAACEKARHARAEGKPEAIVRALEAQCRSSGGTP